MNRFMSLTIMVNVLRFLVFGGTLFTTGWFELLADEEISKTERPKEKMTFIVRSWR